MDDFSDIINLPHHVSKTRRQMPVADRAAQFSAFEALTGFDEDIDETARLTDAREAMSEDDIAELNAAFQRLLELETECPSVTVSYFLPDAYKEGGRYLTYSGMFRHFDAAESKLLFTDGTAISATDICHLSVDAGIRLSASPD